MSDHCTTVRVTVLRTEGAEALVEAPAQGCGRCMEPGGCGGQGLGQLLSSQPRTYWVANDIGAVAGESVELAIAPGVVGATASLIYGVPLLALLLGAVVGMQLGGEPAAMAGAVGALIGAIGLIRRRMRRGLGKLASAPHIIRR